MTSLMAFISGCPDDYLGFILIFYLFVCLVRGAIQINIIEVGLAVEATDDQDFIVAPEQRHDSGRAARSQD